MSENVSYWQNQLLVDYDKVMENIKNLKIEDLKKKSKYTVRLIATFLKNFLEYQEKHKLRVDSVWSELKYPIVQTFDNLYQIVSEYEGKIDKLTCRFYRLSSSGMSNLDFINKYIKNEETISIDPDGKPNSKFFFEIDLTSQDSIKSGIISAIYYMAKFNSLLTITEGSQPTNMAPYVLIASLNKIIQNCCFS